MRFRLMPSGSQFFELFDQASKNAALCAEEINKLIATPDSSEQRFVAIKAIEQSSDEITTAIMRDLESSFVTPFDREDIHGLSEALDDVVDEMYGFADLMNLMRPSPIIPELVAMGETLQNMTTCLVKLTAELKSPQAVKETLKEITVLEREGDAIYRRTMARLFSGEFQPLDVLKWKDIVQSLEAALNKIEDASDVVESIVLKHA